MIVRAFCVDRTGHRRRWNKRRKQKINKYFNKCKFRMKREKFN